MKKTIKALHFLEGEGYFENNLTLHLGPTLHFNIFKKSSLKT